jgi:hypothetical protein
VACWNQQECIAGDGLLTCTAVLPAILLLSNPDPPAAHTAGGRPLPGQCRGSRDCTQLDGWVFCGLLVAAGSGRHQGGFRAASGRPEDWNCSVTAAGDGCAPVCQFMSALAASAVRTEHCVAPCPPAAVPCRQFGDQCHMGALLVRMRLACGYVCAAGVHTVWRRAWGTWQAPFCRPLPTV